MLLVLLELFPVLERLPLLACLEGLLLELLLGLVLLGVVALVAGGVVVLELLPGWRLFGVVPLGMVLLPGLVP